MLKSAFEPYPVLPILQSLELYMFKCHAHTSFVAGLERTSVTRRNTLTRLLEEDLETVTRERAASALSAVTTSPVYSRMASPLSLPGIVTSFILFETTSGYAP